METRVVPKHSTTHAVATHKQQAAATRDVAPKKKSNPTTWAVAQKKPKAATKRAYGEVLLLEPQLGQQ